MQGNGNKDGAKQEEIMKAMRDLLFQLYNHMDHGEAIQLIVKHKELVLVPGKQPKTGMLLITKPSAFVQMALKEQ